MEITEMEYIPLEGVEAPKEKKLPWEIFLEQTRVIEEALRV